MNISNNMGQTTNIWSITLNQLKHCAICDFKMHVLFSCLYKIYCALAYKRRNPVLLNEQLSWRNQALQLLWMVCWPTATDASPVHILHGVIIKYIPIVYILVHHSNAYTCSDNVTSIFALLGNLQTSPPQQWHSP